MGAHHVSSIYGTTLKHAYLIPFRGRREGGVRASVAGSENVSASIDRRLGTVPIVLVDLTGPLRARVGKGGHDWSPSPQGVCGGVSRRMASQNDRRRPRTLVEWALGTYLTPRVARIDMLAAHTDAASRAAGTDMLAVHGAVITESQKTNRSWANW